MFGAFHYPFSLRIPPRWRLIHGCLRCATVRLLTHSEHGLVPQGWRAWKRRQAAAVEDVETEAEMRMVVEMGVERVKAAEGRGVQGEPRVVARGGALRERTRAQVRVGEEAGRIVVGRVHELEAGAEAEKVKAKAETGVVGVQDVKAAAERTQEVAKVAKSKVEARTERENAKPEENAVGVAAAEPTTAARGQIETQAKADVVEKAKAAAAADKPKPTDPRPAPKDSHATTKKA